MDVGERLTAVGCVDTYGYAEIVGSWLIRGWAPATSAPRLFGGLSGDYHLSLYFQNGVLQGEGLVIETLRPDLGDRGYGIALSLSAPHETLGALVSVEFDYQTDRIIMKPTNDAVQSQGWDLIDIVRRQKPMWSGEFTDRFQAVLNRAPFGGHDTLDRFSSQFAFRIDDSVACGSTDLLLNGWMLAGPLGVRSIRLRSGDLSTELHIADAVKVRRPDVVAEYGASLLNRNVNCGFVLHVTDCIEAGGDVYIEIEAVNGETGFVRVKPSRLTGLHAIRSVLGSLSMRYDEVERTLDSIGPALMILNHERLDASRAYREICFGTPIPKPVCSVIVPIYGRLDYMEVQVALMARGNFPTRHELIYVIDDPDGADAACYLADSLFRRFGLPLRLLLLEENIGFAPACNTGLSVASGSHVCFLNSDVFALEAGWIDRLLINFSRHPSVGIVGPLLLFEDGTIQHQGMRYERLPEFSHWLFPMHPSKGTYPSSSKAVAVQPAITGACMVMPRQLALDLKGFDENYMIGDFEDSDLCLRAREFGAECAVDHGVALYHLERKSQASAKDPWRMNMTLYNAWLHQRRWGARLASEAEESGERTATVAVAPLLATKSLRNVAFS